jgi:hypothetical protein
VTFFAAVDLSGFVCTSKIFVALTVNLSGFVRNSKMFRCAADRRFTIPKFSLRD